MAYREDPDLHFLSKLRSPDLNTLHQVLVYDKDGKERWTCGLDACPDYEKFYPDHAYYWSAMAEQLQLYGGNTFANLLRGYGVPYREILHDICSRMKVKCNAANQVQDIERELLLMVMHRVMEKSAPEVRREILRTFHLEQAINMSGPAAMAILQALIKTNGFAAYKLAVIIANSAANAIGIPLSWAANAALTKALSIFAGPVGWILTGIWTAWTIAGPAYRVTMPCVFQIAGLRQSLLQGQIGKFLPRNMYKLKNFILRPIQRRQLALPQ